MDFEQTETQTLVPLDVHRNSWWKSRDNKRLMIVVGIYHAKNETTGNYEASHYDVLDVGEALPKHVTVAHFQESVQRGLLKWVQRPKDAPQPLDLISTVGSL